MFTWEDGHPYSPDYVSHTFHKLLKKYDLPHIRFHDLRHPYVKHTTKNIILKSRKPKLPILVLLDHRKSAPGPCHGPQRILRLTREHANCREEGCSGWSAWAVSLDMASTSRMTC